MAAPDRLIFKVLDIATLKHADVWQILKFRSGGSMHSDEFTSSTALAAALSLQTVFAQRTHRRKFMGQEWVLPGQLGEAVHLPAIISKLQSKAVRRRETGLEDFRQLWLTLSEVTRDKVLQNLGWYNPKELDWEDKRSNKRPSLPDDVHLIAQDGDA